MRKTRTSGFACPWHPQQFISYLIVAYLMVVAWLIFFPAFLFALPLIILHQLLFLCVAISAYLATVTDTTDPALSGPRSMWDAEAPSERDIRARQHIPCRHWCSYCVEHVHAHSKHCRVCDKCVAVFDHHCHWLNTCVGLHNYNYFAVMLASAALFLTLHAGMAITLTVTVLLPSDPMFDAAIEVAAWSGLTAIDAAVMSGVSALLALIGTMFVTKLGVFHWALWVHRLTTYEWILIQREIHRVKRMQEQIKQGLPVTPDLNQQDLQAHRLTLSLASVLLDRDFVDVNANPCFCTRCDTIAQYEDHGSQHVMATDKGAPRVWLPRDYDWRKYHPLDRFNLDSDSPLCATAVGCARLTADSVYDIPNRLFYDDMVSGEDMTRLTQLEQRTEQVNQRPFRGTGAREDSVVSAVMDADDVGIASEEAEEEEEDVFARDSQRCLERTGTGIPRLNFASLSGDDGFALDSAKTSITKVPPVYVGKTEVGPEKSVGKNGEEKNFEEEPEQVWFTSPASLSSVEMPSLRSDGMNTDTGPATGTGTGTGTGRGAGDSRAPIVADPSTTAVISASTTTSTTSTMPTDNVSPATVFAVGDTPRPKSPKDSARVATATCSPSLPLSLLTDTRAAPARVTYTHLTHTQAHAPAHAVSMASAASSPMTLSRPPSHPAFSPSPRLSLVSCQPTLPVTVASSGHTLAGTDVHLDVGDSTSSTRKTQEPLEFRYFGTSGRLNVPASISPSSRSDAGPTTRAHTRQRDFTDDARPSDASLSPSPSPSPTPPQRAVPRASSCAATHTHTALFGAMGVPGDGVGVGMGVGMGLGTGTGLGTSSLFMHSRAASVNALPLLQPSLTQLDRHTHNAHTLATQAPDTQTHGNPAAGVPLAHEAGEPTMGSQHVSIDMDGAYTRMDAGVGGNITAAAANAGVSAAVGGHGDVSGARSARALRMGSARARNHIIAHTGSRPSTPRYGADPYQLSSARYGYPSAAPESPVFPEGYSGSRPGSAALAREGMGSARGTPRTQPTHTSTGTGAGTDSPALSRQPSLAQRVLGYLSPRIDTGVSVDVLYTAADGDGPEFINSEFTNPGAEAEFGPSSLLDVSVAAQGGVVEDDSVAPVISGMTTDIPGIATMVPGAFFTPANTMTLPPSAVVRTDTSTDGNDRGTGIGIGTGTGAGDVSVSGEMEMSMLRTPNAPPRGRTGGDHNTNDAIPIAFATPIPPTQQAHASGHGQGDGRDDRQELVLKGTSMGVFGRDNVGIGAGMGGNGLNATRRNGTSTDTGTGTGRGTPRSARDTNNPILAAMLRDMECDNNLNNPRAPASNLDKHTPRTSALPQETVSPRSIFDPATRQALVARVGTPRKPSGGLPRIDRVPSSNGHGTRHAAEGGDDHGKGAGAGTGAGMGTGAVVTSTLSSRAHPPRRPAPTDGYSVMGTSNSTGTGTGLWSGYEGEDVEVEPISSESSVFAHTGQNSARGTGTVPSMSTHRKMSGGMASWREAHAGDYSSQSPRFDQRLNAHHNATASKPVSNTPRGPSSARVRTLPEIQVRPVPAIDAAVADALRRGGVATKMPSEV